MDRITSMVAFVKVVDSGGFSAAARRLDGSPTMMSKHVQFLEDTLGVRLLNRSTRKISLTEVGKAYYERCTQILGEIDKADAYARSLQSTPQGFLRVNTSPALSVFIARTTARYAELYPEVSIKMTMTDRMIDMIEDGYDLAVRMHPVAESSLIVRRLTTYRLVLCGSPGYFARHGTPKVLAELERHNCLIYSYSPFGHEWRLGGKAAAQSVHVSGRFESNSGYALRLAALSGLGIVTAPHFLVADDLKSGRLVEILQEFPAPELAINIIYPHRQHLSTKVRAFVDIAVKQFHTDLAGLGDDWDSFHDAV